MLRNTERSWGTPARSLHWLIAALILVQVVLGWLAVSWRLSPTKLDLFVWHKSLGLVVLVLALARIGWRLANRAPLPPPDTPPWERRAAGASHLLLYALMLALPLSGWVINSAANVPFRVFWWLRLPAIAPASKALAEAVETVHFALFLVLALLLVIHIGAALRHHFVKRNEVLSRMWFDRRPSP